MCAERARALLTMGMMQLLPPDRRDRVGNSLATIHMGRVDYSRFHPADMLGTSIYWLATMIDDEHQQLHGVTYVETFEGFSIMASMRAQQHLSSADQKEMFSAFTDTIPLRIQRIYVIRQPWYVAPAARLVPYAPAAVSASARSPARLPALRRYFSLFFAFAKVGCDLCARQRWHWLRDGTPRRSGPLHRSPDTSPHLLHIASTASLPPQIFFKSKIVKRVALLGNDMAALHTAIDPANLPPEFGGTFTEPPGAMVDRMVEQEKRVRGCWREERGERGT